MAISFVDQGIHGHLAHWVRVWSTFFTHGFSRMGGHRSDPEEGGGASAPETKGTHLATSYYGLVLSMAQNSLQVTHTMSGAPRAGSGKP